MHAITDAWVYIDGQLIGVFQLPATFPVLQQGTHTLLVQPGVMKDGIAETRIAYPFFQSITRTIDLVPEKTLNEGILNTTYLSKTIFIWKEDFDNAAITLDTTAAATTKINQTPPGDTLTLQGIHSGIITLDTVGATLACASHSMFPIPSSSGAFLELNFNLNCNLTVGVNLYDENSTLITNAPIMTLNPTTNQQPNRKSWKKIYIDLSTALSSYSGEKYFKVYYYFENTTGDHYQIVLDNIKVLSF